MITKINNFFKPVENFLFSQKKLIAYGILLINIFALYSVTSFSLSKIAANMALYILWIILWIPIFSRVFGIRIFTAMMGFRKELGIVMGALVASHFVYTRSAMILFWNANLTKFFILAVLLIVMLFLTLTSNDFSKKILGKNWKILHKTAYILPIFTLFHFSKFPLITTIIVILFYILKICEWRGVRFFTPETVSYPKGQKFLCVPCGYIYDPAVGNIEDGIAPGTEFVDIPDDWRCPDCGVTKADFVPYNEENAPQTQPLEIVEKIFLNPTTIELILKKPENISPKIWQFATFEYEDENGKFRRQYSVSCDENGKIHFLIKLKKDGRGAKILQKIASGENMNFVGFFGDFLLKNSENPKVFIATGTGLAPIFHMMNHAKNAKKRLFMSVATKDEIFYHEELQKIPHLEINYHITREKVNWFREGRMNVSEIFENMPKNTEFYLCGAPNMVKNVVENLKNAGYESVFFEEFQ